MNRRIRFKRWFSDESGVSMIEYGLLGGLIAVVCAATVVALGLNVEALYLQVCQSVAAAAGAPGC
jgi:Flp pilus assembly pilin Flp